MSSQDWKLLQESLKSKENQQDMMLFVETECRYPERVGAYIAAQLVNGRSLNDTLKDLPGISRGMVSAWLAGIQTGGAAGVLQQSYARIREAQAAMLGQMGIELIIDQGSTNPEKDFRNSRVALDGLRWMTGRLDAGNWSDQVNVKHSGEVTLQAIVDEAHKQKSGVIDQARSRTLEGQAETVKIEQQEQIPVESKG